MSSLTAPSPSSPTSPKITLTYFDFLGPTESIRLALTVSSYPFTDQLIPFPQWKSMKETKSNEVSTPWGQLPYMTLEFPGGRTEVVGQSSAILRYVADLTGLTPIDRIVSLRNDEIIEYINVDIKERKIYPTMRVEDEGERLKARKELNDSILPAMFSKVVSKVPDGCAYLTGQKIATSDLVLYALCSWLGSGKLDGITENVVLGNAWLKGHYERLCGNERIREWNEEKRKGRVPFF